MKNFPWRSSSESDFRKRCEVNKTPPSQPDPLHYKARLSIPVATKVPEPKREPRPWKRACLPSTAVPSQFLGPNDCCANYLNFTTPKSMGHASFTKHHVLVPTGHPGHYELCRDRAAVMRTIPVGQLGLQQRGLAALAEERVSRCRGGQDSQCSFLCCPVSSH